MVTRPPDVDEGTEMSDQGDQRPPHDPGAPPPPPPPGYSAAPPPENPYGAAPAYQQPPAAGPVTRPRSMDLAVLLMRIGAGLSLVSVLVVVFATGQMRSQIEDSLADSGVDSSADTVDAAVAVGVTVAVVTSLVAVGLWLFMAWANGAGKSWARIVASVLFGFSLLSFLIGLTQPSPALSRVLSVVNVLLGAAIIVLLWRRESSDYYRAMSAPRA